MSQAIRESFMKISSLFEEQDAATTDIPFVKYPDYENPTEENIRMVISLNQQNYYRGKMILLLGECLHKEHITNWLIYIMRYPNE